MDILKIAKIILSGGTVEEVIQEFENGEFPILDNVQQQMALLIFTEELAGHLFVEEQFLSEALQTWKMLREDVYQIYSFVKTDTLVKTNTFVKTNTLVKNLN